MNQMDFVSAGPCFLSHRQVTPENSIATAGVLGGVTGLLLGGFWATGTAKSMGMSGDTTCYVK